MQTNQQALYYRASQFGNSSHRHADQGNIALFDDGESILTPSGSYGYRFGSGHHSQWTRTTQAHNLPLLGVKGEDGKSQGQILDCESATAKVLRQEQGIGWNLVQLELALAYEGSATLYPYPGDGGGQGAADLRSNFSARSTAFALAVALTPQSIY